MQHLQPEFLPPGYMLRLWNTRLLPVRLRLHDVLRYRRGQIRGLGRAHLPAEPRRRPGSSRARANRREKTREPYASARALIAFTSAASGSAL